MPFSRRRTTCFAKNVLKHIKRKQRHIFPLEINFNLQKISFLMTLGFFMFEFDLELFALKFDLDLFALDLDLFALDFDPNGQC